MQQSFKTLTLLEIDFLRCESSNLIEQVFNWGFLCVEYLRKGYKFKTLIYVLQLVVGKLVDEFT